MELLDIVDEKGNYTGEIVERNKAEDLKLLHWVVTIFIVNSKGQILLQKRNADKKYFPNMWALCSGLVISGETCEEAAMRELKEEVGLGISIDSLNILDKNVNLTRFYYVLCDWDEDKFIIQKEELSEVKWFDIGDVIDMVRNHNDKIVTRGNPLYLFEKLKKEVGIL